jgi:energy-coupling factor transporter ATP-binding protein EcfA2
LAVHAASIYLNDHAVLIAGRSGAGKTTLATQLSPPCQILDDDFSLVCRDGGRFWVTGSPFGRDGRIHRHKTVRLPLERILFTRKAFHADRQSLAFSSAYRSLARNSFTFPALPRITDGLLDNMHLLCADIHMYILHADSITPIVDYLSLVFQENP